MKIQEALKEKRASDVRVSCGHRCLVWGEYEKCWVVREQKPYAHGSIVILSTEIESDAVSALLPEDED